MFRQTGTTECGKMVVGGVYSMCGTHGIPLCVILTYFRENNLAIDCPDFIKDALEEGANIRSVKAKIEAALSDSGCSIVDKSSIMENINKIYP